MFAEDLKLCTDLHLNSSNASPQNAQSDSIKTYLFILFVCRKRVEKDDFFIYVVALYLIDSVKGLDILIDSKLKLDLHTNSIITKVHACADGDDHLAMLV